MTGRGCQGQFAALPDLKLPPLEVFAQRLLQPFSPRILRRDVGSFAVVLLISHHEIVHRAGVGNLRRKRLSQTHRLARLSRQILDGRRGRLAPRRIGPQLTEIERIQVPGCESAAFWGPMA
jgi:hypothetical protein